MLPSQGPDRIPRRESQRPVRAVQQTAARSPVSAPIGEGAIYASMEEFRPRHPGTKLRLGEKRASHVVMIVILDLKSVPRRDGLEEACSAGLCEGR